MNGKQGRRSRLELVGWAAANHTTGSVARVGTPLQLACVEIDSGS